MFGEPVVTVNLEVTAEELSVLDDALMFLRNTKGTNSVLEELATEVKRQMEYLKHILEYSTKVQMEDFDPTLPMLDAKIQDVGGNEEDTEEMDLLD